MKSTLHDTPGRLSRTPRTRVAVALCVAGLFAGAAFAQPVLQPDQPDQPDQADHADHADHADIGAEPGPAAAGGAAVPARLDELVQMLDSPDLALREIATTTLNDDPRVTLEVVEGLLGGAGGKALAPEQRIRLESVGLRKFIQRPRGAMGVQFQPFEDDSDGVVIQMTVGNFESTRVLMVGDVLLSLSGTPINSVDDARAAIISHEPGERVELRIERRGEPMAVSLRLGSFADLQRGANLDTPTMVRAWELRRARAGNAAAKTTSVVVPRLTERRFERLVSADRVASEMREMRRSERANQERTDPMSVFPAEPPAVEDGGASRAFKPVQPFTLDALRAPTSELTALTQNIRILEQRLNTRRQSLNRADPARRARLEQEIAREQAVLDQLRQQQKFEEMRRQQQMRQRGVFQP